MSSLNELNTRNISIMQPILEELDDILDLSSNRNKIDPSSARRQRLGQTRTSIRRQSLVSFDDEDPSNARDVSTEPVPFAPLSTLESEISPNASSSRASNPTAFSPPPSKPTPSTQSLIPTVSPPSSDKEFFQSQLMHIESTWMARLAETERRHELQLQTFERALSSTRSNSDPKDFDRISIQLASAAKQVDDLSIKLATEGSILQTKREQEILKREAAVQAAELRIRETDQEVTALKLALSETLEKTAEESRRAGKRADLEISRAAEILAAAKSAEDGQRRLAEAAEAAAAEQRRQLSEQRVQLEAERRIWSEERSRQEREIAGFWEKIRQAKQEAAVLADSVMSRLVNSEEQLDVFRKAIQSELSTLEDTRRRTNAETSRLNLERREVEKEKLELEAESQRVADLASAVNKKSEEVLIAYERAANAKSEVLLLIEEAQREKAALEHESSKVKGMQQWVDRERHSLVLSLREEKNRESILSASMLQARSPLLDLSTPKRPPSRSGLEEKSKWDRIRRDAEAFDLMVHDIQNRASQIKRTPSPVK